jgi:hypothetical protein
VACLLALASGCAPGRSVVEVTVRSDEGVADVDALGVFVTVDGQHAVPIAVPIAAGPVTIDATHPQTFDLVFDASRSGTLDVQVNAVTNRVATASGVGEGTLAPSRTLSLTVTLIAGSPGDGGAPLDGGPAADR